MNVKPADDYDTLKKQFGALKTYAACQEKMRDHYREAADKLSKLDRNQSAEEIGAERSVNEQLTNDLLRTEDERDQLKAENEALRKDAERLRSATDFVQRLCDSAGKQPSVATGYLHDILSAMGKGEQP